MLAGDECGVLAVSERHATPETRSLFRSHLSICFRLVILVELFVEPLMIGNAANLVKSPLTYLLSEHTQTIANESSVIFTAPEPLAGHV